MEKESKVSEVMSAEILVAVATEDKLEFKTSRGLIDTGTSASLMEKSIVPKDERQDQEGKCAQWRTKAGIFKTRCRVRIKRV